jgi:hypothetical protein
VRGASTRALCNCSGHQHIIALHGTSNHRCRIRLVPSGRLSCNLPPHWRRPHAARPLNFDNQTPRGRRSLGGGGGSAPASSLQGGGCHVNAPTHREGMAPARQLSVWRHRCCCLSLLGVRMGQATRVGTGSCFTTPARSLLTWRCCKEQLCCGHVGSELLCCPDVGVVTAYAHGAHCSLCTTGGSHPSRAPHTPTLNSGHRQFISPAMESDAQACPALSPPHTRARTSPSKPHRWLCAAAPPLLHRRPAARLEGAHTAGHTFHNTLTPHVSGIQ